MADGENLKATELGKVAATKGISVDTAIAMAAFARENAEAAEGVDVFEILWCLTGTEDGRVVHFNLSTREWRSGEYRPMLRQTASILAASARRRLAVEF